MLFLKKFLAWNDRNDEIDDTTRKRRLLHTIAVEFLVIGIILQFINVYLHLWILVSLIFIGMSISVLVIVLLKNNYSLQLCGHLLNIMSLAMIVFVTLWIGGQVDSSVGWLYVLPIVAAATIGFDGLIIYSFFSAFFISLFIFNDFPPLYILAPEYISFLNKINYMCIFMLIIVLVYNISLENMRYESRLKDQYYLLDADKQKFHYLSHHDSLTNLPNRAYFNQHLQNLMDATNTAINSLTLFYMDLDGFKKVNDKYGHSTGDIVLLQTSKRLQTCFRAHDFIARLGGDEFTAVIIHSINDKIADKLTKRIEQEFLLPFCINGLEIKCTISLGKANYPSDGTDAETLLKVADDFMYKNKEDKYRVDAKNGI